MRGHDDSGVVSRLRSRRRPSSLHPATKPPAPGTPQPAQGSPSIRGHEKVSGVSRLRLRRRRIVTAAWDSHCPPLGRCYGRQRSPSFAGIKVAWSQPPSIAAGTRIVTASSDNTARLWDAATGVEIAVMRGHEDWCGVSRLRSRSGTRIVTASSGQHCARLWDTATGVEIAVLRGHGNRSSVSPAVFDRSGTRIVTASWDNTARLCRMLLRAQRSPSCAVMSIQ